MLRNSRKGHLGTQFLSYPVRPPINHPLSSLPPLITTPPYLLSLSIFVLFDIIPINLPVVFYYYYLSLYIESFIARGWWMLCLLLLKERTANILKTKILLQLLLLPKPHNVPNHKCVCVSSVDQATLLLGAEVLEVYFFFYLFFILLLHLFPYSYSFSLIFHIYSHFFSSLTLSSLVSSLLLGF